MDIKQFIEFKTKQITDFQNYWSKNQNKVPEHYPKSNNLEEWEEQLQLFQEELDLNT